MTAQAEPQPFERLIRAVLLHPVALAVKRRVRNARWSVKGRNIATPALPERVDSILFVCLGNICRSPFAARLAALKLRGTNLSGVRCTSAGFSTKQAAMPPHDAKAVAKSYGVSLDDHHPLALSKSLVDAYDLIVVMEAAQLDRMREPYPDAAARTQLLSLYDAGATGYERYHIADPFGQPRAAFSASYDRIDRAVTALLDAIAGRAR